MMAVRANSGRRDARKVAVTTTSELVSRPTTRGVHRRRGLNSRRYTIAMVATDYVVSSLSFLISLLILSVWSRNPQNHIHLFWDNLRHGFWFPIGIVLGFAITGGYRLARRSPTQSTFSDMKDYAMSSALGAFLALGLSYWSHHFGKWSIQVSTQAIAATVVVMFALAISRATLRHVVLKRRPQRVAVVDDGTTYKRIATHLHLQHGVVLVGLIDSRETPSAGSLGSIINVDALVEEHQLDRIVFGTIQATSPDLEHSYRRATELVDTALVPRMFEVISWRSRLTDLSGLPLLELAPRNFSRYDRLLKRAFDIAVALVALTVTLPITVIVALLVKVTSRGPIFFRQERLGRDRKSFVIVKFRTMRDEPHVDAAPVDTDNSAPLYVSRGKMAHQRRLTPIGGFLRRTGIDEIPQFFNVLAGSMSVVGPRPFVTHESEVHSEWSARRFEVPPGITGLWQVSGRNNLTEEELRQLDYLYVSAWSMWWDIKICFDTPRAMVRGLGAY